ncbi:PKD domain-containing protein [Owenweeksia hongkongensis]|uniref:PKD domain-containing protein n=1 Tax=Owenweeksia hongkongensis TaxID=253245 RepID=UPI003A92E6E5
MKKLLFSLMGVVLCGFISQAQLSGTIQGIITDASSQPIPGVAVFYYGSHMVNNPSSPSFDETSFLYYTYTDAVGHYSIGYGNLNSTDSVVVGVFDCQMNPTFLLRQAFNGAITTGSVQVQCVPSACDALVSVDSMIYLPSLPPLFQYTAASLRDSGFAGINTPVIHSWSYNGITRSSINTWQGPNQDTIWIFGQTNPGQVCYQRMASCAPVCSGGSTPAPSHSCNADFFVDSVNSINFQGQVVVWENSTTDAGASIIGYRWDFGDGSATVNQQYPSHTYSDTGVYQVCLTIVSIAQTATGMDTCTSTYCDSIGFDSNGNLIYKSSGQGFTINVVDPATVGQKEIGLQSHFNLFPNPTHGEATLAWEASIGVEQIDVISINGQLIKSITPNTSFIKLNGLETGVYILRVKSEQGETAVRMMVQ